jgi:hypothetical protein
MIHPTDNPDLNRKYKAFLDYSRRLYHDENSIRGRVMKE